VRGRPRSSQLHDGGGKGGNAEARVGGGAPRGAGTTVPLGKDRKVLN